MALSPLAKNMLFLTVLMPVVSTCAVAAVTATVLGAGATVASTAVNAAMAVGKGAIGAASDH